VHFVSSQLSCAVICAVVRSDISDTAILPQTKYEHMSIHMHI